MRNIVLAAITIPSISLYATTVLAGPGERMYGHHGGGFHIIGAILVIVILILAIIGLVTVIRKAVGHQAPVQKSAAIRSLEDAYAAGTIDKETYLERLSVLDPK